MFSAIGLVKFVKCSQSLFFGFIFIPHVAPPQTNFGGHFENPGFAHPAITMFEEWKSNSLNVFTYKSPPPENGTLNILRKM